MYNLLQYSTYIRNILAKDKGYFKKNIHKHIFIQLIIYRDSKSFQKDFLIFKSKILHSYENTPFKKSFF